MSRLRKKSGDTLQEWIEDASQLRRVKAAALFYVQDLFNSEQKEPREYAEEFGVPVRKLVRYLNDPSGFKALIEEAGEGHISATLSKILSDLSRRIHDEEEEYTLKEGTEVAIFLSKLRGGSFEKSPEGVGIGTQINISLPASLQGTPEHQKKIECEIVEDAERKLKRLTE